ncbi:MAG: 3-ketoacyl-ACP reductase [Spirochaetaceae bacterium]
MQQTRTALVSGAGRGIGRAIAVGLAAEGLQVAINYHSNSVAAEEALRLCLEAGAPKAIAVQADIANPAQTEAMLAAVEAKLGIVDVLINNAGRAPSTRADILDASRESFDELLSVNLAGPYFLTQAVARRWISGLDSVQPQPGRAVAFISSVSAETVSLNRGEYCVSKAGIAMASKLWAARLAPYRIPVIEVRPGIMKTDMTSAVQDVYDAKIAAGLVPQRRWGSPEDIARITSALARGDLDFSSGAVLYSDGGFHISQL